MMSKDSSLSKNQKWWEARIANNIWKEYNNLEYRNRELLNVFQTASKNIRDELYELAEKYSKDGVLSRTDMYREKHLQKLEQKYHEMIEQLGNDTEKLATRNMQEAFKNVNQITGESINAEEFATPNKKVMNAALKEPWRGSNFSARLWGSEETIGQMQKLERALDSVLTYGLQTGQSVTQVAVNLNNVMGKGFNESLRLVRTESMHYMNQAALMRYKDSGIDKVQIIAALDERTCSECGKYHEKIYLIDKCPVLPFHPNCRCTVIPYIDKVNSAALDGGNYLSNDQAMVSKKDIHNAYSVNRKLINSKVYHDKIYKLPISKNAKNKIYKQCCNMMNRCDGKPMEHMVAADYRSGDFIVDNYNREGAILKTSFNDEEYAKIEQNKGKIILIHNHSLNVRPSGGDIVSFAKNDKIAISLIACHDGDLYAILSAEKKVEEIYKKAYNNFRNNFDKESAKALATKTLYEKNDNEHGKLFDVRRL